MKSRMLFSALSTCDLNFRFWRVSGVHLLAITLVLGAEISLSGSALSETVTIGENIETHGAIADDGLDDSQAIRDAIAAAVSNGSNVVIVPTGVFNVDSQISFSGSTYNGLQIVGTNRTNSVLKHTGGDACFRVGTFASDTNYVSFKNLTIDATGNSTASAAIHFHHALRTLVENVAFRGYSSTTTGSQSEGGAAIKYSFSWIHNVRNCLFLSCRYGILTVDLDSQGNIANALNVTDSNFEGCQTAIRLKESAMVSIRGNTLEGENTDEIIYLETGKGYSIIGNYFEGNPPSAIRCENSAFLRSVTIVGNYIAVDGDYALNLNGGQGIHVSGNDFSKEPVNAYIRLKTYGATNGLDLGVNTTSHGATDTWSVPYIEYPQEPGTTPRFSTFLRGKIYDIENHNLIFGSKLKLLHAGGDPATVISQWPLSPPGGAMIVSPF